MDNPYASPQVPIDDSLESQQEQPEKNGLFLQLAVVAFFVGLAPIIAWNLSRMDVDLYSYRPGVPKDFAILSSYLYCLIVAMIVNLFVRRGTLHFLKRPEFWIANLKNLHFIVFIWVIFWGGTCLAIQEGVVRIVGEEEWFQIAIVTWACCLQFLLWHAILHGRSIFPKSLGR